MELQSIAAAIISIAISFFAFNMKPKHDNYSAICFRGFLFIISLIFLGFAIALFIANFLIFIFGGNY